MASALVGGLIGSGTDPGRVVLADTDPAARERARDAFGCAVHADADAALDALDGAGPDAPPVGVVLAVKPHHVEAACAALGRRAARAVPGAAFPFLVSIAAGVRIDAMARALGTGAAGGTADGTDDGTGNGIGDGARDAAIVRAMPNTPSLVGRGAAAIVANGACDASVRAAARSLFAGVGTVVELDDEAGLDAVTALSGSGPAYAFALMEHMAAAGVVLGLDADVARRLAIATVAGAGAMADASEESPAELRARVTSKGGTTAAALASFERDGLGAVVGRAMEAARARAVELGAPPDPATAPPTDD